jgi:hypothetical protein
MLIAPISSPAASPQPSTLPQIIGEVTAAAAVALARALCEFQTSGLSFEAKMHVGDLIAQLFELRLCAGRIDFFAAAGAAGARRLRERYGEDLDAKTIAVLIDAVIEALRQVVRAELN